MQTHRRHRQRVPAAELLARWGQGRVDWLVVNDRRQKIRRVSILTHEGLVKVETATAEHSFAPAEAVTAILE
jgi:hypothetical protein